MEEAVSLIHQELTHLTGKLDLRGLHLAELPNDLFKLTHLHDLHIGRDDQGRGGLGSAANIHRLTDFTALQTLGFAGTPIDSLEFIENMVSLKALNFSSTNIVEIKSLSNLTSLEQILFRHTRVRDISCISNLNQIRVLKFSNTPIDNLMPLSRLTRLIELSCASTEVDSLSALSKTYSLRKLECFLTKITDLLPLKGLSRLEHISFANTDISSLDPLRELKLISHLSCSETKINSLEPLNGLSRVQYFYCFGTKIESIDHLYRSKNIASINISNTHVHDISVVKNFRCLKHITLGYTNVKDISALVGLKRLELVNASGCPLNGLPEQLVRSTALQKLYLADTSLPNWPSGGVLSSRYGDNCLSRVRAHLDDLAFGNAIDRRIKLLVLGNGGAGKTQIANWLVDENYQFDARWDSTHGIRVLPAELRGEPALTLSIWDFGGQDIYHGVHALFLHSPALLLLVWAKDTEEQKGHENAELWSRNYPLHYWLTLVRQQAHSFSPILVAQSKCDRAEDRRWPFIMEEAALQGAPYMPLHQYVSVSQRTGREALCQEVRIAADWLHHPERMGVAHVGSGRLRVRNRMEALLAEGRRFLSMEEFRKECADAKGVSAPEHLLVWLDAEGTVLYRQGLFEDQVVLDPAWALAAVYAIFDGKSGLLKRIRTKNGSFTLDDLADGPWGEYSPKDRELLLSIMVACSICFLVGQKRIGDELVAEYVAPDLLPGREAVVGQVPVHWSKKLPVLTETYTYALPHDGLIRTILSLLGRIEPRRDCRRLQLLRGWGYDEKDNEQIFS